MDDEYVAFCLDQAIAYFGNSIDNELDAVEGKTAAEMNLKRQAILSKYLYPDRGIPRGQFADPAALFQ